MQRRKINTIAILYLIFIILLPQFMIIKIADIFKWNRDFSSQGYIILATILLSIFSILYYKDELISKWKEIKDKKLKFFLTGILFFVLVLGVQIVLTTIFAKGQIANSENQKVIENISVPIISKLTPLLVVVFGPILEELVFREYIIGNFKERLPKFLLVIVSAILFSAIHMTSFAEIIAMIPYFSLGLMAAIVYVKNDYNIYYPILVHIINNLIGQIIIFMK